ncbi:MAG: hypothetical protein KKF62_03780 [Bacteroidetes bacterium]|nr:hypothetical protein [Bacteroidota bacterium]MBU1117165.1 hypothetical protein [Bacteroidota bacterium]MBU1798563.1 hypothetical protein [Bacteroidota bacterium]
MKKQLHYVAILLVIFVFGCSTYKPPKTYEVVKEMTYNKSFDDVWNLAIEWFANHGTPIKNMDKVSGFIATEYSLSTRQMNCLDCGSAGQNLFAVQRLDDPRGNFNLLIKKIDDNNVKVTVNCFFKATSNVYFDGKLNSSNTIDCNSTGLLEKEIVEYLGK